MPRKRWPVWTHPFVYGAARFAVATANTLPPREASSIAMAVGRHWAERRSNRARLARMCDTISWCFPDWEADRVHACAVESYGHMFKLATHLACAPRLIAGDGWPSFIRLGETMGALDLLLAQRPCIVITGHCGNWEAIGYAVASLGFPVNALYRPLDNRWLDGWATRSRAGFGLRLISKFSGSEALPEILGRGESVAFIADQNAGERGLFVPFFDRLASTYKSIGLLAIRHQAPIICGQTRCVSHEESEHGAIVYRMDAVDVIHPHEWVDQPDPLFYITARYRRAIEHMVHRAPDQFLWLHRYWKSRPRFERMGRPLAQAAPGLRAKIAALPWMTDESLARIEARSARDARECGSFRETGVPAPAQAEPLPA